MSEKRSGGEGKQFSQLSEPAKQKARDHYRAAHPAGAGGGQGGQPTDAEIDQALLRAGKRFDDDGEEC
jgi:hypothetical protein